MVEVVSRHLNPATAIPLLAELARLEEGAAQQAALYRENAINQTLRATHMRGPFRFSNRLLIPTDTAHD